MDHFPSSKPVEKASSNSNCGLNQQTVTTYILFKTD